MSSEYENNNIENNESKKDNPVLGCLFFIIVIPLTLKLLAPPKTYFVCKNHICQIEYKKKFFSKGKTEHIELNMIKAFTLKSFSRRNSSGSPGCAYYIYAQTIDGQEYRFSEIGYKNKNEASGLADSLNAILYIKPAELNMPLN